MAIFTYVSRYIALLQLRDIAAASLRTNTHIHRLLHKDEVSQARVNTFTAIESSQEARQRGHFRVDSSDSILGREIQIITALYYIHFHSQ
jgi:hypothetical protein